MRHLSASVRERRVEVCESDPRWLMAKSVVSGPHFERSPLLSKFLLFVVAESLAGRQASISEHRIGVAVFGRPHTYRTDEDNIVRNYARQLRRRLTEHFVGIGKNELTRIEIPLGGYIPEFIANTPSSQITDRDTAGPVSVTPFQRPGNEPAPPAGHSWRDRVRSRRAFRATFIATGAIVVASLLWVFAYRPLVRASSSNTSEILWHALLPDKGTVYVVPSDAGFNLTEDISHRRVPLAEYIRGAYNEIDASGLNSHTRQDLSLQPYTDFVSLQIIALLAHRPEYDPKRVLLRFPRDLRIDDLKSASAFLIGSANSNPWAALADAKTNFRVVPSDDMEGAAIVNTHPLAGEHSVYQSHWNEPSHETYALILFAPNLSGAGYLLAVEGLDIAGTEAAAELLFHPESIASIVERARRPDGSLGPFEILLRATSIQSNAEGTQVIGGRIG